jgi:hypothetical protein
VNVRQDAGVSVHERGGGALFRPQSGAAAVLERVRREICAAWPRDGAGLGIDG